MKCDKLKAEPMIINDDYTALYYPKESVDAAIDELKREHHKERDEFIDWVNRLQKENAELKAVIAELKNRIAPKQSDKTLQERLNEVCEKHGVSTLQDLDWDFCESEKRNTKYCIEAYKVIAELKSEIERLEILCANYRHDCDNLATSNEQSKRAASTLLKKMDHNKRKRCLAMAKLCHWKMGVFIYKEEKRNFYHRWHKRWMEIATKFKEAK